MQDTLIQQLSSKGILAYVAVSMLGNGEVTTAALAELVKSQAGAIREGLHELSLVAPVVCRKAPKNKWSCGEIQAGDGVIVQILDSKDSRRKDFLDDVKAIFEWANRDSGMMFTMNSADGSAVSKFLRQYKDWDRPMWQQALRHRFTSEVVLSQPLYLWLSRIAEYVDAPLDRYGKPMKHGGGKHEQVAATRQRNREAVANAIARA